MKKLIALVLTLVMAFALTAPALAAETDDLTPVPAAGHDPSYNGELARNAFIAAHGGVPGQFNLMVNGKFLTFPAERPLYQAAGITYVDARTLSKALGAEVSADERGYAAVRPAAEAAGFLCFWDRQYNAGVLLSPDTLAAEIDKDFTVYNRLLVQNVYTGGNQRTAGSVKGTLTLFDSLDGNRTADFSASYDLTASKAGGSGTANYDLSALWAVFEDYIPAPLDMDYYPEDYAQEYAQMMELVKSLMKGNAEVRFDLENQTVYFSMPVLFQALNGQFAQSGVQLPDHGWFSLALDGAGPDLESLFPSSAPTMGSTLCAGLSALSSLPAEAAADLGCGSAEFYDDIMKLAARYAALIGDEQFTRKGNADVLTFTLEDLSVLFDEDDYTYQSLPFSQFEFTLKVKENGDMEQDLVCRLSMDDGSVSLGDVAAITAHSTVKSGKAEATMDVHVKNILKLTLTAQETRAQTSQAPQVTPPKGAMILDLNSLGALGA